MGGGRFREGRALLILVLGFLAAVVLVNPLGDFPMDDDFAYGKTVKGWYETGTLRIHGWISATEVFHAFVGLLVSVPFGFSFTALRFSSLLMALAGAVAAYFILRELRFDERKSLLGASLTLFNPLYFSKAFNFHADVHFMAMLLLSVLFYVKAANRRNDVRLMALASFFSVLAILIRQNGVFIPMATAAFFWLGRKGRKFSLVHFSVIAILPFLAFLAYSYWYYGVHGATESGLSMLGYNAEQLSALLFPLFPFRLFSIFIYIGLFALPLLAFSLLNLRPCLRQLTPRGRASFFLLAALGASSAAFLFFVYGKVLFYLPTMLHSRGIGPVYLQGAKPPLFPPAILAALALAAILSAALLFARAWEALRKAGSWKAVPPELLVYLVGVFQLPFMFLSLALFDRYLLPLFFPATVFLLREKRFFSLKASAALLVLMALFSVAGTQDYLSWGRAKNEAIGSLLAKGVPPESIDGGFEHAAWNFYEYVRAHPEVNHARPSDPGWVRLFPVIDSEYVVSFSPLPGYRLVEEHSYFSLLTLRAGRVYVLSRSGGC